MLGGHLHRVHKPFLQASSRLLQRPQGHAHHALIDLGAPPQATSPQASYPQAVQQQCAQQRHCQQPMLTRMQAPSTLGPLPCLSGPGGFRVQTQLKPHPHQPLHHTLPRSHGSQSTFVTRASSPIAMGHAPFHAGPSTTEAEGGAPTHRLEALPVVWHPMYSAPQLAPGHRFPMQVFGRIYERLLQQQLITTDQVHVPPSLPSLDELCLVHTREYVDAFREGKLDPVRARRIGFGDALHSPALIERTQAEVAGTLLTARLALRCGLAVNTAGGTHHAFPDTGSGFCILNDLAITTKVLLREGVVSRVLVVDLDVHQGDGTAVCLADEPRAFTLSMHCESNFPARKQRSTLDIGLPDGTTDTQYLSRLADELPAVLNSFRPDLVLFDAGVDVHKDDNLGRLALTDNGLARRESLVLDTCLAEGIPVAGYVGGGYDADLDVLADRHIALHRAALSLWKAYAL